MEGTYPVIIDGELVGKLTVTLRGPLTDFDVTCKLLPGIIRLSVYGGDQEGYLGVLAPEGDSLSLHKTLSRAALREFPTTIDAVELAGRPTQQSETVLVTDEPTDTEPLQDMIPMPDPEPVADYVPETPAPERCWYASPDGALVCFDGEKNLVAFPVDDARLPENAAGEPCTVEGREYRVFSTENGRVMW